MLLGVNIQSTYENRIDRLEGVKGGAFLRAAPNPFSGGEILFLAENQGDIEGDSRGGQILHGGKARRGRGDFDHAVFVAFCIMLAQFNVFGGSLGRA